MRKNLKYVFPNGEKYTFDELKKLAKEKGIEVQNVGTGKGILDVYDRLKDDEFIFCITFQLHCANVFMFCKKNERTDKETFIKYVEFSKI